MSFQFMCPQGHLLEGDYAQMGQTIQCPVCAMDFIVPTVEVPAEVSAGASTEPSFASEAGGEAIEEFSLRRGPRNGGQPVDDPSEVSAPAMIHYPCKCGQVLQVPKDMLGQTVMCPFCGKVIELHYRKTLEGRREKEDAEQRRLARSGRLWMNWAIVIAIFVGIGLVGMIAALSQY